VKHPALLLLPGLGLGAEAWEPTIRHVSLTTAFRHVTVLPLPGYGMPARRGDDLAPSTLARVVVDRLAGAGPTVLAGHSASCQVAAHAAARVGRTVHGLALVGPTTDPRARGWPRLARRWLATARHEPRRQVPALVRQYRRTTLRSMAQAMDAARHDDIQRTLQDVDCPVLVVRGVHDRICSAEWAAQLAPTITLPAGGHMVPLTHGDRVAEVLRRLVHAG
jgi:pimeloyl-ACP methyl ester carboxylesterase